MIYLEEDHIRVVLLHEGTDGQHPLAEKDILPRPDIVRRPRERDAWRPGLGRGACDTARRRRGEEDVRAVLSSLVQMDLNYPFFFIQ